jgi:hypothetical protein
MIFCRFTYKPAILRQNDHIMKIIILDSETNLFDAGLPPVIYQPLKMENMNNQYLFRIAIAIFALLYSHQSFSQKQAANWYFGINAALTFSNGGNPQVVTNGALNTTEGSSVMSDANGNLLFYTDGVSVWNNTHSVMPNGTGLLGDPSTTQSALIVKKPGSTSLYYIFTLPAEGVGNFCYSVVDMTLDNGKGDVTTKNTVLKNGVTEKLSGVYHCNRTDIWVTIHELGSKAFYSYSVTANGVSSPVVSTTGRLHSRVHGYMKFSSDGSRLACLRDTMTQATPYQGLAYLDLHNFNNQTGVVTYSFTINLNNWQKSYGVEFSPDNSKVYATYYDVTGGNGGNSELVQYNLTATNVVSSGVTVGTSFDPNILRALQQAPNGKIYVSKSGTSFVSVINSPNSLGTACSYTDNAINVDSLMVGAGCMLGLPNFVQSYFNPLFPDLPACPTNTNINTTGVDLQTGIYGPVFYFDQTACELAFNLKHATYGNYILKVFNIMGNVLYENNLEVSSSQNDEKRLNAADFAPGVYIIRVSGSGYESQNRFLRW